MPAPRIESDFNHRKKNTSRGQKTLGSLPVLLVALKAPLQFCDTSAIAVAHKTGHLRLQYAQIAQHLRFKFIHHPHPPDSICPLVPGNLTAYEPNGRLMNNAVENSE